MQPIDMLDLAAQRRRELESEAIAERLRPPSPLRRLAAASLRRVADRLDPTASGRGLTPAGGRTCGAANRA
jgi:hypothetical protein